MWEKVEEAIWQLAVLLIGIMIFFELIDFHKWWSNPSTAEAIYAEEMLESVKNGDLVLCATSMEDSEDRTKTSMVVEMAMIVDINRPHSQELDGRRLGKKSLMLDIKKYTEFERCKWVAVIKDEEDKKEVISNILIRGVPAVVDFPNQSPPPPTKTPHYLFF